jgi:hypothetical protein
MAHSTFLSIALILPVLAAQKIEGLQTFIARCFRSARNRLSKQPGEQAAIIGHGRSEAVAQRSSATTLLSGLWDANTKPQHEDL